MIDLQQSGAGLAGYALLAAQAEALFADERDFIANAAQFSAFLFHELGDLNWAGFYLNRNEELVLGPFQGQGRLRPHPLLQGRLRRRGAYPADPAGRRRPRVSRPHRLRQRFQQRTGGASAQDGRLVAVLDLDSLSVGRFSAEDQAGIEGLVEIFLRLTDC